MSEGPLLEQTLTNKLIYNECEVVEIGEVKPITISWQLVTECQFQCSYCYFNPYESSINYIPISKLVLHQLTKIKYNFEIALLGGEPTLHPDFFGIVEEIYKLERNQKIDIITNFNKDLNFWTKLLPFKDKINLVLSLHFEYANIDFLKKIESIKNDFSIRLVFMVHPDEKHINKMKHFYEKLISFKSKNFIITYLKIFNKDDGSVYDKYDEKILDFLIFLEKNSQDDSEKLNITYLNGSKGKITQLEILNNRLNMFKGWRCQMNEFVIRPNGYVISPCLKGEKYITFYNFDSHIINCPHEFCGCEGYWNYLKKK